VFFTLIAEPLYILVDTAIVGRISTDALGGLALAGSVLVSVTWLFGFLATGVTTQVGQRLGAGDRVGAQTAVAQGAWLATGLSLIAVLVLVVFGPWILRLLGGTGAVLINATTYLRISSLGVPAILLTFLALGWLRGSSNMRTPLIVAAAANALNVVLELVLVFGFDFGIAGSAWGTVMVQWLSVLWLLRVVLRDVRPQRLHGRELRGLVTIGGAMLLRTGSMIATITYATSAAARGGREVLGGHQIAIQTFSFLAFAIDALAISTQTVFAEELGRSTSQANQGIAHLRSLTIRLVRLGGIAGCTLGLILAASSPWLPRLFSPDPSVQHTALIALLLLAVMQLTGAVVFTLDGVLMGANLFGRLAAVAASSGIAFALTLALTEAGPGSRIAHIWIALNVWMLARLTGNVVVASSQFAKPNSR
jgi:putative MATE family efflux protein